MRRVHLSRGLHPTTHPPQCRRMTAGMLQPLQAWSDTALSWSFSAHRSFVQTASEFNCTNVRFVLRVVPNAPPQVLPGLRIRCGQPAAGAVAALPHAVGPPPRRNAQVSSHGCHAWNPATECCWTATLTVTHHLQKLVHDAGMNLCFNNTFMQASVAMLLQLVAMNTVVFAPSSSCPRG